MFSNVVLTFSLQLKIFSFSCIILICGDITFIIAWSPQSTWVNLYGSKLVKFTYRKPLLEEMERLFFLYQLKPVEQSGSSADTVTVNDRSEERVAPGTKHQSLRHNIAPVRQSVCPNPAGTHTDARREGRVSSAPVKVVAK